jgi:Ni,Fe-hydrogenase III large subunit
MDSTYNEACSIVKTYRSDPEYLKNVASDFSKAVQDLVNSLAPSDAIIDRIMASAKCGNTTIELLRFLGNEVHDSGFAFLSLIKGSKTPEFSDIMKEEYGFQNVMDTLRQLYDPFDVYHSWNTRTTLNKITLSWKE